MADNQQIAQLLQKFANGQINQQEYNELIAHFKLSGNEEEMLSAMDSIWQATAGPEDLITEAEAGLAYQKLVGSTAYQNARGKARVIGLWYRVAAAAVLFIVLTAGAYWSITNHQKAAMVAASDKIGPGGNRATLTLAGGKVINLGDARIGNVARQQNIAVTKTASGQLVYHITPQQSNNKTAQAYNTITTPRGGQYQVELPDGTKVWLNTASSLRFPVQFSGAERKVNLTGEAYFEVAKNKHQPFKVITANQQVEVLGTHFNINGYNDEGTVKTTLFEGSVKVTLNDKTNAGSQVVLTPNEESVNQNTWLTKHEADIEEALAWKNGLFLFNGESLGQIMKQASRWYDVDIVFEDSTLKSQVFSGSISRFKNISQLLEVLESTGSVHFKIEGRRLTAMK
ncbi:FecR family protein [Mucilaginibacter gracilis]|uniref:FecR family protein n=1 Tax=Mucilaginibacter gracilis TaxID=423350 RepID=A0A495J7R8_9SPHI|nr:FecR domain-containing protein [Mucilaginibacter gracilis]RKR84059.1 FecR family protein [Mucilaginibacter gracilis]